MSDQIHVNIGDLAQAAVQVRRVSESLHDGAPVTAGNLGHARLQGALAGFGERWSFGLGRIGEDAAQFASRLDASARAYRDTDEKIAQLAKRLTEEITPNASALTPLGLSR